MRTNTINLPVQYNTPRDPPYMFNTLFTCLTALTCQFSLTGSTCHSHSPKPGPVSGSVSEVLTHLAMQCAPDGRVWFGGRGSANCVINAALPPAIITTLSGYGRLKYNGADPDHLMTPGSSVLWGLEGILLSFNHFSISFFVTLFFFIV